MLALALCNRRLMAVEAEVLAHFHKQVRNGRFVRSMATHALPVLDRLMLNFLAGDKIGVARETERRHASSHSHAERVLMAGGAFPLGVRRMAEQGGDFFCSSSRFLPGGYSCDISGLRQRCGYPIGSRSLLRDAVKEEGQPLALTGRVAPGGQQETKSAHQPKQHQQPGCFDASWLRAHGLVSPRSSV